MKHLKSFEDICLTCGTNKEDENNGLCINDHDDWFGLDDYENFAEYDSDSTRKRARKIFKMSDKELIENLEKK